MLHRIGAQHFPDALGAAVSPLLNLVADLPRDRAGIRLRGQPGLAALLAGDGPIGRIAAARLGERARPVRAVLFDKSPAANWALGWHQDRTICVEARRDVGGFGPWTVKRGLIHVEPPFAIIERMMTLRVHLDAVPADNAPLLIAPGSHLLGRIPADEVDVVVARCGTQACLAAAGDIWAYATAILHASQAASDPCQRRVLQVDYSADTLPSGLEWSGV